jgi:hypothetical protein
MGRPALFDTDAVLAFVRGDEGADSVASTLMRGPGLITTLTLFEVLSSLPFERIEIARATLTDTFDVIEMAEEDAYVGAYTSRIPGRSPRFERSSGWVNEAAALRLDAGFVAFGFERVGNPSQAEEGAATASARQVRYVEEPV